MKITRLQAENFKILRAIDIRPGEGSVVPIRGKNAQGKSSTLDAIQAALGGRAAMPDVPVRAGETDGAIRLELDDGALMVRRTFDVHGKDTLVVEQAGEHGKFRPTSPQKMLDSLFAAVAFDPLAFTRLKPAEQLNVLKGMVEIDFDIAASEQADKADYETRRDVNRDIKRIEAEIFGMGEVDGLPEKAIDLDAITKQIAMASEINAKSDFALREWQHAQGRLKEVDGQIEALMEVKRELLKVAPPNNPPHIDISDLQTKQAEAITINRKIETRDRRKAAELLLAAEQKRSQELTDRMEQRAKDREAAIAAANMPVEGLSFGDGVVLFNGVPFEQASSAEQLRVSTAIGMAGNPKLRVMLVRDGSLLDEDGAALLAKMAEDHDFQFWVEAVGEGGAGIILEDGAVAGAEAPAPIDKGATRKATKDEIQAAAEIARQDDPEPPQEAKEPQPGTQEPEQPEGATAASEPVLDTEDERPPVDEEQPAVDDDDDGPLSGPVTLGESLFDDD